MRKAVLFIISLTLSTIAFGQINQNQNLTNNWRFGGGLGLSFGNDSYFGFNISPSIGYMISTNLEVGGIAGYQHLSNNYYKRNLFNVGLYINFFPIENIFVRANYVYYTGKETYRTKNLQYETISESYNVEESALWLGAGYQTSGPIKFQVGAMYNVLYKDNDTGIFSSGFQPFMGVSVGL